MAAKLRAMELRQTREQELAGALAEIALRLRQVYDIDPSNHKDMVHAAITLHADGSVDVVDENMYPMLVAVTPKEMFEAWRK